MAASWKFSRAMLSLSRLRNVPKHRFAFHSEPSFAYRIMVEWNSIALRNLSSELIIVANFDDRQVWQHCATVFFWDDFAAINGGWAGEILLCNEDDIIIAQ